MLEKKILNGFPLCFYLQLNFHSEALKVKLTHLFSHIWVSAFYWVSVIVLFVVHCRVVTDRSCMREEEALHASVICSAVTICRWRHRSRLPPTAARTFSSYLLFMSLQLPFKIVYTRTCTHLLYRVLPLPFPDSLPSPFSSSLLPCFTLSPPRLAVLWKMDVCIPRADGPVVTACTRLTL